jgi:hypothetical protein
MQISESQNPRTKSQMPGDAWSLALGSRNLVLGCLASALPIPYKITTDHFRSEAEKADALGHFILGQRIGLIAITI